MSVSKSSVSQSLKLYSSFVVLAVLSLIFLGALVKSHEAGLSVPDWPATYGQNMFLFPYSQWIGGIFYEHSHRLLASMIGLSTIILSVWLHVAGASRGLRRASVIVVLLVCLQGLLGGLTVLYGLPDAISISHGILAQSILLILTGIAFFLRNPYTGSRRAYSRTDYLGLAVLGVLFMQLFFGALMRHAEAGLAVLDFPTMAGNWIPVINDMVLSNINQSRVAMGMAPVDSFQVFTHILHRLWAFAVAAILIWYSARLVSADSQKTRMCSLWIMSGLFIQFTLGIVTIVSLRHPWITSFHVVVGAGLWACCLWAFLTNRYGSSQASLKRSTPVNLTPHKRAA